MKILIFRTAALGDFVMTVPAIKKVRELFSDAHITLLTSSTTDSKQKLKVNKYTGGKSKLPWVELVMPHLIDSVVSFELSDFFNLHRNLYKEKFDLIIIMDDVGISRMSIIKQILFLFFLTGSFKIVGWRDHFISGRNPHKKKMKGTLKHHVFGPLQFLKDLKTNYILDDKDVSFDLRPRESSLQWAIHFFEQNDLLNKKIVAIAPGSIQTHKQWPEQNYIDLVRKFIDYHQDVRIILIGIKSDIAVCEKMLLIDSLRIFNLAGLLDINTLAALFSKCDLVVGNDGGSMHLGDAMGCKVVSIISGIEYEDSIEPWHNKLNVVRSNKVSCSPCYNFLYCTEGDNVCVTKIGVDLVFRKCLELIS
jgi:heptosyltransferase-2